MTDDPTPVSHPESLRFVQTDSFEVPSIDAVAAGVDGILLATANGELIRIDDGGRRVISELPHIVDVAVADRAYVLTETVLEAYTPAGSRVWSADVDGGESIDADPDTDDVYVRTRNGEFIRFEGRTGSQRVRFDQPHADVTEVPAIAAHGGRLAIASWTFLTVLSLDGDVVSEVTLDGAATDLGLVGDRAVVSLKDGRVLGQGESDTPWDLDSETAWLADAGGTFLLCDLDGTVGVMDADGAFEPLDGIRGTPVAATSEPAFLCTRQADTVAVYEVIDEESASVTADITSEAISRSDQGIEVLLRNEGESTAEVEAAVEADGATFTTGTLGATLSPGEVHRRRLAFRDLDPDADAIRATITLDDEETTGIVELREANSELDTTVELHSVNRGTLTAEVRVQNDGDVPIDNVEVGSTSVGTLAPGDVRSVPLESELPSGQIPVRGEGVDVDPVDLTVPSTPTDIGVDTDENGFLVVSLDNDTPVSVVEEFAVREGHLPGEWLEFEVEIPANGGVRYALPVVEGGDRQVLIETSAGRVTKDLSLSRTPVLPDIPDAVSDPGPPSTVTDATPDRFDQEGRTDTPPISVEREVSVSSPVRGMRFIERLAIENEATDSVTVELVTDDGEYRQRQRIEGGDRVVGRREHVAYGDSVTLPAVRLLGDWGEVAEPAAELAVEAGSLAPTISWGETEGGGKIDYEFSASADWDVSSLEFVEGNDVTLDLSVAEGTTRRGEVALPSPPDRKVVALRIHGISGDESRTVDTLAPHESLVERTIGTPLDELELDVNLEWSHRRKKGLMDLSLHNNSEEAVRDLHVEAESQALQEWTKPHQIDEIPVCGEGAYTLDLDSVGANNTLTVDFRLASGETVRTFTVRAEADESGYVAADTVAVEDTDSSGPGFPERISTSYR